MAILSPESVAVAGAQPIEFYGDEARSLDAQAFTAKHGNGFLLLTAADLNPPREATTRLLLDGIDQAPASARTVDVAVVVYALVPQQSAQGHLVTMGRTPTHDVVIPDPSISRFHAFAKQVEDGTFVLQDAGSTNGTTVNGASVPGRGAGEPVPVKPGDTVRLGQVECTFTDGPGLHSFAAKSR